MSATSVARFPMRRAACVWLLHADAAWLVQAGDHAWAHGDYFAALIDARWLAQNLGLPIRSTVREQLRRFGGKGARRADFAANRNATSHTNGDDHE